MPRTRTPAGPPRYRLRVALLGIEPEIWRSLDLDGTLRLNELDHAIQIAFGWRDVHEHQFTDQDPYAPRHDLPRIGRAPRRWVRGFMGFVDPGDEGALLENEWSIADVFADFDGPLYYEYDSGDGWMHRIELIEARNDGEPLAVPVPMHVPSSGERCAVLVGGARRGPLEDSGGIAGYQEVIDALAVPSHAVPSHAAPSHPQHDERRRWVDVTLGPWEDFDPEHFDPEHVNDELALRFDLEATDMSGLLVPGSTLTENAPIVDLVARMPVPLRSGLRALLKRTGALEPAQIDEHMASTMVRPFAWLLSRVGDGGITLTKAGWLPPAVVSDAVRDLGWHDRVVGAANREENAIPVLSLRENAEQFGLLRKQRGRLLLTPAARALADGRDGFRLITLQPDAFEPVALWHYLAMNIVKKVGIDAAADAASDAALLLALQLAADRATDLHALTEPIAFGLDALGWKLSDGQPLTEREVMLLTRATWDALVDMGALERSGMVTGAATTEGRAFARAMLQG